MGWIHDRFERRVETENSDSDTRSREMRVEALAENKWQELLRGLRKDLEEYRRLGGDASLAEVSDVQCKISNPSPRVIAEITADPAAHTIRYTFSSDAADTAVPEGGFFSIRSSPSNQADLYSADQRVSDEQVRRMILEPLLFPTLPRSA